MDLNDRKPLEFVTQHRASFADMDPYNHLNSTHYIRFMMEHRFSQMRELLGWNLKHLNEMPIAFYTTELKVRYLRPITSDEPFTIRSRISKEGERDCEVSFEVLKENGKQAATATMIFACFHKERGRVDAWPREIISAFYES